MAESFDVVPGAGTVWTRELAANHAALSDVDLRFRELALATPALRSREPFRALGFDRQEIGFWIGHPQAWPMFVGPQCRAQLVRAAEGVSRLVRLVPERLYGNDPERISRTFGLDPLLVELLLEPPSPIDSELARADLVLGARGFRCLEMNFGGALGGMATLRRQQLYESVPEVRAFLEREGLTWRETDALRASLNYFVDCALALGLGADGPLNLAAAAPEETYPDAFEELTAGVYREVLSSRGLPFGGRFYWTPAYRLHAEADALWLGSERIHGVFDISPLGIHPACFPLACAGELVLFGGPVLRLMSNKALLADLSQCLQDVGSSAFDDDERDIIRDHVPWTRRVAPGEVRFRDRDWSLAELLATCRRDLVLKAERSFGGKDVAVGLALDDDEWRAAVARAFDGSRKWIVQEYEESSRFLFQSDSEFGCEAHDVIWGPFVFGGRYAGTVVRVQPTRQLGPLNVSLGASTTSMVEV